MPRINCQTITNYVYNFFASYAGYNAIQPTSETSDQESISSADDELKFQCYKYELMFPVDKNPPQIKRCGKTPSDLKNLIENESLKLLSCQVVFIPPDQMEPLENSTYYKELKKNGWASLLKSYHLLLLCNEAQVPLENLKKAFQQCQIAADTYQNVPAQALLARLYEEGIGCEQNSKRAFTYFKKASESGHSAAISALGTYYIKGIVVPRDLSKGLQHLKKAFDLKNPDAYYILACIQLKGDETLPPNTELAAHYLKQAAELGHDPAMDMLGNMYLGGQYIGKDEAQGFKYIEMAAKEGNLDSILQLANMYYSGLGGRIDLEKSLKYYRVFDLRTKNWLHVFNSYAFQHSLPIVKREHFLMKFIDLDQYQFALQLRTELYSYKYFLTRALLSQHDSHVHIENLRRQYHLIYDNIECSWSLLTRDELMDLASHFANLIKKIQLFNPDDIASTKEEIEQSYLADLKLPKKSARKRVTHKRKKEEIIPTAPPPIKILPHPAPALVNEPKMSPPKRPTAEPKPIKELKTHPQKADPSEDHILRALDLIKQRHERMRAYYLGLSEKGHCEQEMHALFDKKSMSAKDLDKLIRFIAQEENGRVRELEKGGKIPLLTLGPYTCGGHKPHGKSKQNDVDPGMLADLRQVLEAHFTSKKL